MVAFDFGEFQREFGMTVAYAVKIFGVSRRTVYRWRAERFVPRSAWHLILTIQRQAAPWASQFGRCGEVQLRRGMVFLDVRWRNDLFGGESGRWQDFRTWQERDRLARWMAEAPARKAAQEAAYKRSRVLAGRKGAATRRARLAAAQQALPLAPPTPTILPASRRDSRSGTASAGGGRPGRPPSLPPAVLAGAILSAASRHHPEVSP